MKPMVLSEPGVRPQRATRAQDALIRLSGVGVRFGTVQALAGVSFAVQPGERLALVGANGSGKSTLLRVLHGLAAACEGQVVRPSTARHAMLFQHPHMLRTTALNNVAVALWLRGTPWRAARMQALQALARVDLTDVAGRAARALSGGQQQRLALARVWALAPEVLLLDEPTASLDPHASREVEALLQTLAQGQVGSHPMTLVFASHNLGQVRRLASRVLYLERGQLLADLPVAEFFDVGRLSAVSPQACLFVKGEL